MEALLITYEELIEKFTETMVKVGEFLGEEEGWGKQFNFTSKHQPLKNRITNINEVAWFFKKRNPGYLCMLEENCDFYHGFHCSYASLRGYGGVPGGGGEEKVDLLSLPSFNSSGGFEKLGEKFRETKRTIKERVAEVFSMGKKKRKYDDQRID